MRHFVLKKAIFQIVKDFLFGIGLFVTIFAMAAIDANTAWTAPNHDLETIIDGTNIAIVDKIEPQHKMATFIQNSLRPEFSDIAPKSGVQLIEVDMSTASAFQFLTVDALYLAFIAILFASMFTLTIGLSRYVRRESASPRRTEWRRG